MSSSVTKREKEHGARAGNQPVLHYPFWFGGSASCFAASVTHPLDLGKLLTVKNFGRMTANGLDS